jgi:glycosyltransferase involved in cell wall biosynthesis
MIAQMPSVTVLVPVHNGRAFVRETLEALLRQSLREFAVLVIDDGSSDGSAEVIRTLRDPRIRLLRQPNRGLSETLNRGLGEIETEFVALNDQDDLSAIHRLERQLDVCTRNPSVACLFSNYTKFGSRRRWANADKQKHVPGELRRFEPQRAGCQLPSTLFGRTAVLRRLGFRQIYHPADDWDFQLRLADAGDVRILSEPLVAYRFHLAANTYRDFSLGLAKSQWAEDSYLRRRRGEAERPFEEFLANRSETSGERRRRVRAERARLQIRLAGQRFLDGRDTVALVHAVAYLFLNPLGCWRRLRGLATSTARRCFSDRPGSRVRGARA